METKFPISETTEIPLIRIYADFLILSSRCRTKRSIKEELRRNITSQINGEYKIQRSKQMINKRHFGELLFEGAQRVTC